MKKILILDDEKVRHDRFDEIFHKMLVDHAYNVDDFKKLTAANGPYDMMFLDHDLGAETKPGKNELTDAQTGNDAVTHLLTKVPMAKLPKSVVVHSHNTVASGKMVKRLQEKGIPAVYRPFEAKPK